MCKKSEYTIVAKQCVQCMFYRDLSIVAKELLNVEALLTEHFVTIFHPVSKQFYLFLDYPNFLLKFFLFLNHLLLKWKTHSLLFEFHLEWVLQYPWIYQQSFSSSWSLEDNTFILPLLKWWFCIVIKCFLYIHHYCTLPPLVISIPPFSSIVVGAGKWFSSAYSSPWNSFSSAYRNHFQELLDAM